MGEMNLLLLLYIFTNWRQRLGSGMSGASYNNQTIFYLQTNLAVLLLKEIKVV